MKENDERAGWNKWDSVVEKVLKHMGGNQDEIISVCECGGYQTKVRNMIEIRGK